MDRNIERLIDRFKKYFSNDVTKTGDFIKLYNCKNDTDMQAAIYSVWQRKYNLTDNSRLQ